jgi:hypothetical protein
MSITKNITETAIRVSFIDKDGKKVNNVSVKEANKIAKKNPGIKFYFQNGDGVEKELTIDQVNQLKTNNILPTAPACPTAPQVCGPPLVRFFGGGGMESSANAIISPISSSIIGFDIIDSGFGYFDSPSAELIDPCGKGSGAKLQVNLEDDEEDTANIEDEIATGGATEETGDDGTGTGGTGTGTGTGGTGTGGTGTGTGGTGTGTGGTGDTGGTGTGTGTGGTGTGTGGTGDTGGTGTGGTGTGTGVPTTETQCEAPRRLFEKSMLRRLRRSKRIKNITIIAPGDGYLAVPDGSLGGNERVWKEPDEGFVRTKCGGYYVVQPYRPIKVEAGDTYYPPDGPPRTLTEPEIVTLPLVPVTPPPPENVGTTYPVVLIIDEIKVLDPGFGYRPGDQLIINPSNGAVADLVINERGEIEKVDVIQSGIGFLDLPNLSTNSPTGFNATFSTIFKPIRIDTNKPTEEQIREFIENKIISNKPINIDSNIIPEQIQVISVIDCVGKIPPAQTFRVPR